VWSSQTTVLFRDMVAFIMKCGLSIAHVPW
jgi:hypothetical protein